MIKMEHSSLQDEVIELMQSHSKVKKQVIEKVKGKNLVLLVGYSKVGKSTLCNAIMGNVLNVQKINLTYLIYKSNKKSKGPQIGDKIGESQSFEIDFSNVNDNILADCPGFNDTRGYKYDVKNCLSIRTALQYCKSCKVLLVITQNILEEGKCERLQDLIKNISESFNSLNKHSFILCVNQAEKQLDQKDVKGTIKQLYSSIKHKFTQKQKNVYEFLIQQCEVQIIQKPKKGQNSFKILDTTKDKILKINPEYKNDFNSSGFNFLSQKSILQIKNLIDNIKNVKDKNEKLNYDQKIALTKINQKIQQIDRGQISPEGALESLGIGSLVGGGISITVSGVTYIIASQVAKYGATLIAAAATEAAVAIGATYLATATQVIAFLSGPIGIGVGITITGVAGLVGYAVNKGNKKKKALQAIQQTKSITQNAIRAYDLIISQQNYLIQSLSKIIK